MALHLHRLETLAWLALFVSGGTGAEITPEDREPTCAFVGRTLVRFRFSAAFDRSGRRHEAQEAAQPHC